MSSICPLLRKDRGLLVSLSSCTLKNSLSLHHYAKIVPLGSTAWSSSPHKQDQKSNLHRVICNESADSVVQRGCRLWSVRACVVLSLRILKFTGVQGKCAVSSRHDPGRDWLHKRHTHKITFFSWGEWGHWDIPAAWICLSLAIHYVFVSLVDPIDIVKDYIPPHEYLVEEDPKLYQSVKTKRGPLSEDWIEEIGQNLGQSSVMCAYKLCKVEFRYWGMQSKIERFIHDVGRYGLHVCMFLCGSDLTTYRHIFYWKTRKNQSLR